MTPQMMLSCVGPRKWDQAPNPHAKRVFLVYVNKAGEKAMFAKEPSTFPAGTVIVKEKYPRADVLAIASKRTGKKEFPTNFTIVPIDKRDVVTLKPELRTVMVKEKTGWKYFAVGSDGKVMEGDTKYCADCHQGKQTRDEVYRSYVRQSTLRSVRR